MIMGSSDLYYMKGIRMTMEELNNLNINTPIHTFKDTKFSEKVLYSLYMVYYI